MSESKKTKEQLQKEIIRLKTSLIKKIDKLLTKKGLMTSTNIKNMEKKELKTLIRENEIFKGYSTLTKPQLIKKILASEWFESQIKKIKKIKETAKKDIKKPSSKTAAPAAPPIAPPPPAAPPAPPAAPPLSGKNKLLTHNKEIHLDGTENKRLDLGHTIVNVYAGGSSHPDYPIPQSLVRQALDMQKLPPIERKELTNFIKSEAKKAEITEGIPEKHIPKPTTKKWETVETVTRNKPITDITDIKSKGKKSVKKALKKELKTLPKSSGFGGDFKKRLENKLAAQQGLDLPYPELEEEDDDDDDDDDE
jgi:hypothetical protein